jgi:uncharacterized membrane protein
MAKQVKRVVGIFESEQEAIIAIEGLLAQGYDTQDICVVGKDLKNINHVSDETGVVAEETATGAITGGTIGGVTGLLVGVGALAIPGAGPIIAAGPIATSLIGAIAGAGLGGLAGALIGLGIPEEEAEYYGNSVKEGNILVLTKDSTNDRDILEPEPISHENGANIEEINRRDAFIDGNSGLNRNFKI